MKIASIIHLEKESNYIIFILTYILIYILCCYRILIKYPSVWVILFLISSTQWLILERGNNDMMMFSFVFLSLQVANEVIISILIIIPSLLKIYPFFAVLYLYKKVRSFMMVTILSLLYFIYNIKDILTDRIVSGTEAINSYGSQATSILINTLMPSAKTSTIEISAVLLICSALITLLGNKYKILELDTDISVEEKNYFICGSSIFLSTYVLHTNYDYRLVFLLLTIPYIIKLRNIILKYSIFIALLGSCNWQLISVIIKEPGGLVTNYIFKNVTFCLLLTILVNNFISIHDKTLIIKLLGSRSINLRLNKLI